MFCPDLQNLLKPIYDLTRKDRQFIWGQEIQSVFDEIKNRLQKTPVLHLPDGKARFDIYPDGKARFDLYSDTRKYAMGSVLYQMHNGNQS